MKLVKKRRLSLATTGRVDLGRRWGVLLERGGVHGIGFDCSPEEALEVAYGSMESITGLRRDQMIHVLGLLDLTRVDDLNLSLSKYGFELVRVKT